jgi:SAM-dependent methyltransferase
VFESNGTTRVPDEWYVGFHRGLAARFWRAAGAAMADADERAVLAALGGRGGSVLDVPCGDGRITARLAAAGYDAIGVDISAEEVEHARALHAGVRFEAGDLRALPAVGPVGAVLCWGNSFGYMSPDDTERSLAELHRVLEPGGRLVLESSTIAESLLANGIGERSEHVFGGIRMTTEHRYVAAESRLEGEHELEADGVIEHTRSAHRIHTAGELVRLLRAAGFGDVELRGPDGTGAYAVGDRRVVAVAAA